MFQNICLVFFAIPNTCKTRTRTGVKKRQTIQTNREYSTSENRKTHKHTHTERTKKKNVSGELCFVSPDTSSINVISSKR